MVKKINNILYKYLSYRIIRSHTGIELKKISKYKSRPIYIEFLGVSGVGKTTLFNAVEQQKNKKWISATDILKINKDAIKQMSSRKIANYYQQLARYRTADLLDDSLNPIEKMARFGYNHRILLQDAFIFSQRRKQTILNDDGLLHNFTDSFIKLYKADKSLFENAIKNRAIIYCYNSPEIVVDQVFKRYKETGYLNLLHKSSNKHESIEIQKQLLEKKKVLKNYCNEYEIASLMINTGDPQKININKINDFIDSLQKSNNTFTN